MNTIKYATGRTYDTEQVLEIALLDSDVCEFGTVVGKALFLDRSRHIAASVDFVSFSNTPEAIGKAVLGVYDSGDYHLKIFSHVESMF